MPPEFLNSREDAILIWAVLILAFAFSQNGSAIASSLWSVVCALFGKVFILFALAAAYSAAVLILANRLGVFHASATKEAIYWFFGVGLVLVGSATHATPDSSYAKQVVLRRVLTATILTDFVVNFYVFPLGAEIVLVFIIFLFVTLQVVATRDPRAQSAVPFINGVLIAVGLFLFISFAAKVTTDLDGFLTRDTAELLFVVPAMTIAAIPLLYIVAWYSRREQERIRRQLRSA